VTVLPELSKQIEHASMAELPALIGELEQAKALAWSRLSSHVAQPLPAPGDSDDQLLNVKQVHEVLNVPVSYVYDLARQHKLPKVKVGKYLRFPRAELLAWARQQGIDGRLSTVYSPFRGRKGAQKAPARLRVDANGPRPAPGRPLEHASTVGARRGTDPSRHGSVDHATDQAIG